MLVPLILFISLLFSFQQQPKQPPDAVVQSFYKWYIHALNQNSDPFYKQRKTTRKYVSRRLVKEIDNMVKGPDGLNGDYFLDAQDWDKEWEDNIVIVKTSVDKGKAEVELSLKGPNMGRTLKIRLVEESGSWKIDNVENAER